jgi:hypothetical protein
MLVQMENCVIESNHSYGMEIYARANTSFFNYFNFKALWFENNCYQSNDRYALYIHSEMSSPYPAYVRFEQCSFGASTDAQSCINIQRAVFVTFDECGFSCSNPDRDIVLGAGAVGTSFKNNCYLLPADIGTKGTNTVVLSTGTGGMGAALAPPVSGSYSVGDVVWNSAPSPGGNVGWVCITAGAPGTWKAFGTIAN